MTFRAENWPDLRSDGGNSKGHVMRALILTMRFHTSSPEAVVVSGTRVVASTGEIVTVPGSEVADQAFEKASRDKGKLQLTAGNFWPLIERMNMKAGGVPASPSDGSVPPCLAATIAKKLVCAHCCIALEIAS